MKIVLQTLVSQAFAISVALSNFSSVAMADEIERHEYHSDYDKLKAYRTYVAITDMQPYAHQFTARFNDVEGVFLRVRGNSVAEIMALTAEEMPGVGGGLVPNHIRVKPAPAAFKHIEDAVRARLLQLHPNMRDLELRYEGELRSIALQEYIPMDFEKDVFLRRTYGAEVSFVQTKGSRTLKRDPSAMAMSSNNILCDSWDKTSCVAEPKWVPFVSSSDAEARSLIWYSISKRVGERSQRLKFPELDRDLRRLMTSVIKAANAIEAGNYTNPLSEIVAQQDGDLPSTLKIFTNFSLSCMGAKEPQGEEIGAGAQFGFTLDQLLSQGIDLNGSMKTLGVAVTFKASKKKIVVTLTNGKGDSIEKSFRIKMKLLEANGAKAIDGGIGIVKEINEGNGLWWTLPGDDRFPGGYRCWESESGLSTRPVGTLQGFSSSDE
jgi:hypothetical protein